MYYYGCPMKSTILFLLASIAVSEVDIRTKRIPNQYIVLPYAFALAESLSLGTRFALVRLVESLAVLAFFLAFRKLVKGRFGLGDVKLIAASTMSFGIVGTLLEVLCASFVALLWAVAKVGKDVRFAFAPFLAIGMAVAILVEPFMGAFLAM